MTTKKKKRRVRRSFIAAVILLPVLICAVIASLYFSSDVSNVASIRIYNTTFLSDGCILDYLDLSLDDKYLLVIPAFKKLKVRNNPLIKDLSIVKADNNCIIIDVHKNPIVAYCSNDDNVENPINLVLDNGDTIPFNSELIKSLTSLPLLYKMNENQIATAAVQLSKIDCDILSRISEICCVPFTYDSSMLKCIMDDHYDIYIPISELANMNHYLDMIKDINKENGAILYFEGVFLNMSDEEISAKIQQNRLYQED